MKVIKNKNNNLKRVALLLSSLLLLGIITTLGVFFYFHQKSSSTTPKANTINYSKPSTSQLQAGNTIKNSSAKKAGENPPSSTANVNISITAKNQLSNSYAIRALLDTVTNTGTCHLTLTNNSTTLSYDAAVQPQASVSTCEGFNVPLGNTGLTPGVWNLKLEYINNNQTVGVTTSSIEVK